MRVNGIHFARSANKANFRLQPDVEFFAHALANMMRQVDDILTCRVGLVDQYQRLLTMNSSATKSRTF